MPRRFPIVRLAPAFSIIGVCSAQVGSLAPPAGPVAPTDRALRATDTRIPINDETAPGSPSANHRITVSGHYFLTGDILAQNGKNAIEIAASGVTIDLNGYGLVGRGFFTTSSLSGVTRQAGSPAR